METEKEMLLGIKNILRRKVWNLNNIQQIFIFMKCNITISQMADYFGVSKNAVYKQKVKIKKIFDKYGDIFYYIYLFSQNNFDTVFTIVNKERNLKKQKLLTYYDWCKISNFILSKHKNK